MICFCNDGIGRYFLFHGMVHVVFSTGRDDMYASLRRYVAVNAFIHGGGFGVCDARGRCGAVGSV